MKHCNVGTILAFFVTGLTMITSFLLSMLMLGKVIDKFFEE